jgi:hypothetical protein
VAIAQPDSLFLKPKQETQVFYGWNTKKEVGFYLNQVSFSNWNAGGTNSVSGMLTGKYVANYKEEKMFWNTSINARYGINKQAEQELRKTEDIFEVISNYGYQNDENSNWFYSARFSFSTQFANGFNYPDTERRISKFMAPGYLFFGAGVEYGRNIEKLSLYLSPLTFKTTFVFDEELANSGAFGVRPAIFDEEGNLLRPGRRIRRELGILLTNQYEDELWDNVKVRSLLRLYTDYLESFGNIDVDWELMVDFKVNQYIKAMFGSHIRYDNDIKTEVERDDITNVERVVVGAKVQWKQILGIGVVVDLDTLIKKEPSS